MTGARILAFGGFTAGILGAVGGFIAPYAKTAGPFLLGGANLVMLLTNVIVMARKDR